MRIALLIWSVWMLTACASGGTPSPVIPLPPTEAMEPCPELEAPPSGQRLALLANHLENMAKHHDCRRRLDGLQRYVCSLIPTQPRCRSPP